MYIYEQLAPCELLVSMIVLSFYLKNIDQCAYVQLCIGVTSKKEA